MILPIVREPGIGFVAYSPLSRGFLTGQTWVVARGEDIVPIRGTKLRRHLEENLAAEAVTLTLGDLAEIDGALPLGAAAGDRYREAGMRVVGR